MAIDPTTTALVLIEYQNDFTSEGGALHEAVAPVMDSTGMLGKTKNVVEAARAAGVTVMHAPITFAEGYHEISSHPYGILKGVVDGKAFVKDSWGAAIVDDLTPQAGDIVSKASGGWTPSPAPTSTSCCAAGYSHDRAGRVPDQLLRRVDHAQRLRERLPGDHAVRLYGCHLGRGTRQRAALRLPDVLGVDERGRTARRPALETGSAGKTVGQVRAVPWMSRLMISGAHTDRIGHPDRRNSARAQGTDSVEVLARLVGAEIGVGRQAHDRLDRDGSAKLIRLPS